jgi:hypothetical protein
LLKSGFGAYFLSRPRRFGKSLLLSTLEAIFKNKRELFKGFWIYDSEYVWEEFPVIKFDMSTVDKDTAEEMSYGLKQAVKENADSYKIELEDGSAGTMFKNLIRKLYEKYNRQAVEDEIDVAFSVLDTYDIESLPLIPIMFDAGYLTISNYIQMNGHPIYTLALPNEEVRTSINILSINTRKFI